ncbi:nuA4 complex subunit EAF3 homolog isoform X2 [Contarinia nasturtii]|uniref:nuA4 complex subunit EAF3 homolog isoform X2 n=1 Tax=Contarinia nasturtii TaxID=265458 RepID=UPI0012D37728|nr:nuA4 complex subunit EAF3 homolog isoform X2 [Contarinia nasturtii]
MPPKPRFADGEKVLCFNGPLLYEAKALKSSIAMGKQVVYLIHYVVSDEKKWVTENCVLKFNDANLYLQKVISAENKRASKQKKPDASGKDSDSDASTPWKEVTAADQSLSTFSNTPSTSRCRDAPKPASATSVTGTPNQ